jgi:hypothetical protein
MFIGIQDITCCLKIYTETIPPIAKRKMGMGRFFPSIGNNEPYGKPPDFAIYWCNHVSPDTGWFVAPIVDSNDPISRCK